MKRYQKDEERGWTWCNLFVRKYLSWYGWNEFETSDQDQAGEMTFFMQTHPEVFEEVSYEVAHHHANQGRAVIAGQISENRNSSGKKWIATGHVCVIAPEKKLHYSPTWKKHVPLCANVGNRNFYGEGLSYAFKTEPRLFLYLGKRRKA